MRAVLRAAAFAMAVAAPGFAGAQERLRVIDTAANDVLNVRAFPGTEARIVGVIPPDGRGLVPTGEVSGNWIHVRYGRIEGWVSRRFVAPDGPPVQRGPGTAGGDGKS